MEMENEGRLVDGFFIGGTTAEGAYLTTQEKGEALKTVRAVSEGMPKTNQFPVRYHPALRQFHRSGKRRDGDLWTPFFVLMPEWDVQRRFLLIDFP